MSFTMNRTTSGRTLLSGAVLFALLAPLAHSRDLTNGNSATVNAGDMPESWRLFDGSSLTVNDGAASLDIEASSGSAVNLTGATVSGRIFLSESTSLIQRSTLLSTSPSQSTLTVATFLSGTLGPSAARVEDSIIIGEGTAVTVGNSSDLTLSNTRVTATGSDPIYGAIYNAAGFVAITNGSQVIGDVHGMRIASAFGPTASDANGSLTVIDASRVEGAGGNALHVRTEREVADVETTILVRNGAVLVGGNGNIVLVEKGRATVYPDNIVNLEIESSVQNGNIVLVDDGNTLNVALTNGGRVNGMFDNVTHLALSDGGHWQLTADSNIGSLALATGGVVELGNGNLFNALTAASFTGSGGTLHFNTRLGDDGSASDRLHVLGDTSGQAFVSVKNAGGAGAQTVQGIQLIQVDGASNGQFQLAGRAVGGLYEYFLYKGGVSTPADGGWYLRSELPAAPDPCDANPTAPGCPGAPVDPVDPVTPVDPVDPVVPIPLLRPEPGAYLANLRASQMMFRTDYHSRQDGQNNGRAWARVDGQRTGFDAVDGQLDIHGNSQALNVGADLLRNDAGSGAGVMLSSGNATSTSTSTLTGYWARGKVKGNAVGVYGTWRGLGNDDGSGLYVDGWAQYQQFHNRVEGIGLATERYDSKAWQGAVETGYAFRLGSAVLLEPQLQVGYTDLTMDDHTEANGTIVRSDRDGGLFGRAGLRLSGAHPIGTSGASVQPYLQANWVYNRNSEAISFDGEIADTRIPKSRVQVGGGASLRFAGGFGAWGGLSVESASGYRTTSAQVGMSYRW